MSDPSIVNRIISLELAASDMRWIRDMLDTLNGAHLTNPYWTEITGRYGWNPQGEPAVLRVLVEETHRYLEDQIVTLAAEAAAVFYE